MTWEKFYCLVSALNSKYCPDYLTYSYFRNELVEMLAFDYFYFYGYDYFDYVLLFLLGESSSADFGFLAY
jgi:hypothetical protein